MKKVILTILVVLVGIFVAAYFLLPRIIPEAAEYITFQTTFDPSRVPPITSNPIDASRVFAISQFRSNAGHDYSMGAWDGETCRSMKHYFNWSQNTANGMPVRSVPGPGESNINIFAPFDGTIIATDQEQTPIGKQIHIASSQNSHFYVILFHVDLLPSLHIGSKVESGQLLGTIGPKDGTDVAYRESLFPFKTVYLSIFQYMTDQAFAAYQALGHQRSDFILTRAQADAKGYQCQGQEFVGGNIQDPNNMPGIVYLRPNPYQNQYQQH